MNDAIRRIRALFSKDLHDAVRDARVLIALVLPLGVGIFYNLTFDDDTATSVRPTIAAYSADHTNFVAQIDEALAGLAVIQIDEYDSPDGVREAVAADAASIGLIIGPGFDETLQSGGKPELTVIRAAGSNIAGDYVLSAIDPAVRAMAGQQLPVTVTIEQTPEVEPDNVVDKIGVRTWSLAIAILMMIALISALAIPIVLAEEFEKKTIDALVLAMPYSEVVAAKALLGLFYISLSTIVFLLITRLDVVRWPWFLSGVALTSVALLGFGLLLAGIFRNANQLNTWSGLFLTPFIIPALMVGQPLPDTVQTIITLFPSGAGMQLVLKSLTSAELFTDTWKPVVVLLFWICVAYGALLWQLKRRQA